MDCFSGWGPAHAARGLNSPNRVSLSEIPGHKHFTFGHLPVIEATETPTR
jgi:hypothetical protein